MFETLVSNEKLKKELTRAAEESKPLHAYMFCGAEGSGKRTAALAFAAQIVGADKQRVLKRTCADVIFVEPEPDKKTVSVDIIRKMRADAFVSPTESKRKVYIINGDALGAAGQNALLTVLEQPPSFSVFIIVCLSREKMLSTVVSRCSVYDMEYVGENEGAQFLKTKFASFSIDELKMFVRASQGNLGLAMSMAGDKGFIKLVEFCEKTALCVANGDKYTVLADITKLSKDKQKLKKFLSLLLTYFRDITVYNISGSDSMLVFYSSILKNASDFAKINDEACYRCTRACADALSCIDSNISVSLVVCDLCIQLFGGISLD